MCTDDSAPSEDQGVDSEGSEGKEWPLGIPGCEFDPDLFLEGNNRPRMTRREKRDQRKEFAIGMAAHSLDMTTDDLRRLQQGDPTLSGLRSAAQGQPQTCVYEENGLLYRQWVPHREGELRTCQQLILPLQCRKVVLRLAHKIPMAGHLGQKKTRDRVLQRFYWPTVFQDVQDLCQACPECSQGKD